MKRIFQSYWLNVLLLALLGWGMVPFFSMQAQFAETVVGSGDEFSIVVDIFPIVVLLGVGLLLTVLLIPYKRKEGLSWAQLFLPAEFAEDDERERAITGKACRNSYIAMWYVVPVLAVVMTFYPFVQEQAPYFPALILLIVPLVQLTVFHLTLRWNLSRPDRF